MSGLPNMYASSSKAADLVYTSGKSYVQMLQLIIDVICGLCGESGDHMGEWMLQHITMYDGHH